MVTLGPDNANSSSPLKEEIVEYDENKSVVLSYMTFVEEGDRTLMELSKIWRDPISRMKYHEYYSHEKLMYYSIQALKLLARLHSSTAGPGLYLSSNTTPHNLQVMLIVNTDT